MHYTETFIKIFSTIVNAFIDLFKVLNYYILQEF